MVGHGFRLLEEDWVGGASVECVFLAGVEGIPSDKPRIYFPDGGKESWGRVNVWTWRCVKLYCPGVFICSTTAERGPFYMLRNLTWRPHTCVKPLLCTFLSTFVYFFFDSIVIPHLLFLEGDRGDRRVPGTCWYGCDTWEPLSNTASCCHDGELTDHGAMQANAFNSGMRHY